MKKEDDDGLDENVYWEKVTALATVATLITSTLVGFFGIYLGSQAIKLSGEVASAQMRPLLQGERVWFGPGGDSSFTLENNGFGPLTVRQSVYVLFDDSGKVEDRLILSKATTADDVLSFLGLQVFTNDGRVMVGLPTIDSTMGANKSVPIIEITEHQQRSQFFKSQNKANLEKAVRQMGVCIVYDALDERRQLFSEKGACEILKISKRRIRLKTK